MKKDEQKNLEDDITQKQLEEEFRQLNYRFHIQLGMSEEEATQKAQEEVQTVFSDKGRISREEIEHISGMLESVLEVLEEPTDVDAILRDAIQRKRKKDVKTLLLLVILWIFIFAMIIIFS